MNVTLSIDNRLLKEARGVAKAMGKSVNQLVREYLQQLTSRDDPEGDIEELRQLSADSAGRPHGWSFDRDEIHARVTSSTPRPADRGDDRWHPGREPFSPDAVAD